jgi:hypothetical protein
MGGPNPDQQGILGYFAAQSVRNNLKNLFQNRSSNKETSSPVSGDGFSTRGAKRSRHLLSNNTPLIRKSFCYVDHHSALMLRELKVE